MNQLNIIEHEGVKQYFVNSENVSEDGPSPHVGVEAATAFRSLACVAFAIAATARLLAANFMSPRRDITSPMVLVGFGFEQISRSTKQADSLPWSRFPNTITHLPSQ